MPKKAVILWVKNVEKSLTIMEVHFIILIIVFWKSKIGSRQFFWKKLAFSMYGVAGGNDDGKLE